MLDYIVIHQQNSTQNYINAKGIFLEKQINASHVDTLWLPHIRIHWETGLPDLNNRSFTTSTHCSAFVASFAKSLGIYILRPPEHGQRLLANAQINWLNSFDGRNHGWLPLKEDIKKAQIEANNGNLVLATWKNPNSDHPGHIAVVRPSTKSNSEIMKNGLDIAQAGSFNSINTSLVEGFKHHKGAWIEDGKGTIQYFVHIKTDSK